MAHPVVKNIAIKIANKKKSDNMLITPVEAVIESVIQDIDIPLYGVRGLKTSKSLTLSESLSQADKNNGEIIHLPSGNNQVKFMLQAYEFYANKGFLGKIENGNDLPNPGVLAINQADQGVMANWNEVPANIQIDIDNHNENVDFFGNDPEEEEDNN